MTSTKIPSPLFAATDFTLSNLRVFRGPNIWRLAPVAVCDVHLGPLAAVSSAQLPDFADRLLDLIPSLHQHPCSRKRPGGFAERLREGTYLPHIAEHVALEMQHLAGSEVEFGRIVQDEASGVAHVVVGYEEESVGLQSLEATEAIIRAVIAGEEIDMEGLVDELARLYNRRALGPTARVMVEEAKRREIPIRRVYGEYTVQLGLGRNLRRIKSTMTDFTSIIAVDITSDKDRTKRALSRIGLGVPEGDVARTLDEALDIVREIGYPVLLKPLDANNGRGISARIDDEEGVREAWPRAVAEHPKVVVERFVEGRDHRVVVVGGRVVAVAERVPAHVIGDGTSTISELIEVENRNPMRGKGPSNPLALLPADALTEAFLARDGRTLDTVPAPGEQVFLRATANISTGGVPIDRTDDIHPDNVAACEMAASVIGLDVAGLDVLTNDISVPFRQNGAAIIEVNASPGIRMHTHPVAGKPRNVPGAILDMLYPPGTTAGIPVIAVTGTNGKTTTTRLVAHLLRQTGKAVGYTTTDGVYLQNRLVLEGDMTGPFSANVVLSNPTIDVAVLETARGGILRSGLGFDACDVGIVLNVTADHLGLRGIDTVEQLAAVKAIVPSVVKRTGFAILNADDPLVLAMRTKTRADVVLFSAAPEASEAISEHLESGGVAAVVEGDQFVIRRGRLCIPIASVGDVPLTMGGAARFQFENILAATAAAFVQGLRYEDIRDGLLSFAPSPTMTPGRLNLVRLPKGRVIIDYAHNAAAIEGLFDFISRLDARRRIIVVSVPGDRRDDDIRDVGRVCGRFDKVLIKEVDMYRRGRPEGETAALIAEGVGENGRDDGWEIHPDEPTAIRRALEVMQEGDVVVILAADFHEALQLVKPLSVGV